MSEAVKILIVDDEADIAKALTLRLEASGYKVIAASDGLMGLEMIRSEKPDLVLLDIMLPKLDGFKVCRMVKFDENLKNIPIIILTAKATEIDKTTGGDVGAEEYVTKPFDPEKLMAMIQKYTQGKKK